MGSAEIEVPATLRGNDLVTSARFGTTGHSLATIVRDIAEKLDTSGLNFGDEHQEVVRSFVVSLATKRFVILSGLSGSGKSRLAIGLGEWFGNNQLHVEAVRPDWTSPEALLGAENASSESADARYAWQVPRVLEFILRAARNPRAPYLLLLDEMNLAHVEQYFADVLSGMESGQPVVPNLRLESGFWRMPVMDAEYLSWPSNLFVVGTINVDETTYTFSPKVLDRANTIEFRVLPSALHNDYRQMRRVERGNADLVATFLARSRGQDPHWDEKDVFVSRLKQLHELLYEHDIEFGHRVFREALRFGALLSDAGEPSETAALDLVIVQKILPKIEPAPEQSIEAILDLAALACPVPADSIAELARLRARDVTLPMTFSRVRRLAKRLNKSSV